MVCSGFGFELRSSGIGYLPLPSRGPRGPSESGLPPIEGAGACHALARARQCAGRIARSIPCSGCGSIIPAWWAARSGVVGGFTSQTWPQGWLAPCGRRPAPPGNRPLGPRAPAAPMPAGGGRPNPGLGGYSRLSAAPTRSRRSSRPGPLHPKLTARITTAT
jgi:hypothetical protein